MSLSVAVHKDIGEYREKVVGKLSLRTLICVALGLAASVAAAALFDSGNIYTGVNVESASLGATICAERNAIFHAVAEGDRKLLAVAVVGGRDGDIDYVYCVPCGICRQVMRDFADKDEMLVISAKSPDDYIEHTLEEMLPMSFGPEAL